MAGKEICIYNLDKTCSPCPASAEDPRRSQNQVCYKCLLASLEVQLGRIPIVEDVESWMSVDDIPFACPNGYRSPKNLPLR